jgi:hypothetical protein
VLLLLLLEDDGTGGMGGGDGREWAKQTQRCRRLAEGGNLEQRPEIRGSTEAHRAATWTSLGYRVLGRRVGGYKSANETVIAVLAPKAN